MTDRATNLSNAMPVNDGALGGELVGDGDVDGVADLGPDGRAGELAVDSHHNVLKAVQLLKHVLHIEPVVSHICSS